MRAVVDTNVFISAAMSVKGAPRRVFELARDRVFTLVASQAMFDELSRVLRYQHIARKLGVAAEALIADLRAVALIVEPVTTPIDIRDPDDAIIVQTAIAADAQYLVTGDADLLALREYEGIEVVRPAQFVARLVELPER